MRSPPTQTVISLGGGVQSSVMALMASRGAFDRVPDCAVFADTHWEPPSIYTHLEWLAGQLRFPLHVVDNGRSLREDVKALTNHSGSQNYVDIPVYLKGRDGEGDGTRVEPGREVADPVDGVFREERLGQLPQVEPPERGVLQGAVVEIEAVDVNVGDQSLLPYKDRDRHSGRSRPYRRIDRGGVRTLPRSGGGCQQDL